MRAGSLGHPCKILLSLDSWHYHTPLQRGRPASRVGPRGYLSKSPIVCNLRPYESIVCTNRVGRDTYSKSKAISWGYRPSSIFLELVTASGCWCASILLRASGMGIVLSCDSVYAPHAAAVRGLPGTDSEVTTCHSRKRLSSASVDWFLVTRLTRQGATSRFEFLMLCCMIQPLRGVP